MVGEIGVNRQNDGHIVDVAGQFPEMLGHRDPGLAGRNEFHLRGKQAVGWRSRADVGRLGALSFKLFEQGLGVECVDLGRAATHEQKDDPFCLRCVMRNRVGARLSGLTDQRGQTQHSESAPYPAEHFPSGDGVHRLIAK